MNHHRVTKERRQPYSRWAFRTGIFLTSAIGVLVLISACAKRPQVVTPTEQGLYPPTEALSAVPPAPVPEGAAAPSVAQPSAEPQAPAGEAAPAQGPPSQAPTSVAHPEVPAPSVARPSAPEAHGPAAAPTVSPMPARAPQAQGSTEQGLYPTTEALGAVPAAPASGVTPSSSPPARSEKVTAPPAPPREQPARQVAQAAPKGVSLEDIFFDFDRSELRPDAKAGLEGDVAWLKAHPKTAITIEGHCDERGTSEYNLGLGERRAHAAKDYLAALGIDPNRLTILSYGKERPFVLGHDESAWRWNRRDHMVVGK